MANYTSIEICAGAGGQALAKIGHRMLLNRYKTFRTILVAAADKLLVQIRRAPGADRLCRRLFLALLSSVLP